MITQNIKVTKQNLNQILINKMFEIIGSCETYENLLETNDETWYQDYTWNKEQEDVFKKFAYPLIKKTYNLNKALAEKELMWFLLGYGLKRNDYE